MIAQIIDVLFVRRSGIQSSEPTFLLSDENLPAPTIEAHNEAAPHKRIGGSAEKSAEGLIVECSAAGQDIAIDQEIGN